MVGPLARTRAERMVSDAREQWRRAVQLLAILAGVTVIHVVAQVSDYLVMTWMIVGLGGAVFLSLMLVGAQAQVQLDPLARFHWILLTAYLVHQFEEHGVDLLGRAYSFITYSRTVIDNVGAASGFQLTPLAIYRTNTLFVWLPFLAAVWGHRRFIWPGLAVGGLVLTNAILHIGIALWREEYNPGLGSAIVLFLPTAFLYFRFVAQHCGVGWQGIVGGVLFGAAAHGLLLLRIRFNLGPAMPPLVLGVIAVAPLIANALYHQLRRP
jgi:hypothetical protein